MTNRQEEFEIEEGKLNRQIRFYKSVSYALVCLGIGAMVPGIVAFCQNGGGFSLGNLANFGSYVQGPVASFWSLAALVMIYVAFLGQKQQNLGQKQQLILQREELEHQRQQMQAQEQGQAAELKEQRQQFAVQHESIKRQNFEASFFQLVNLHNQIVTEMRELDGKYQGRYFFWEFTDKITNSAIEGLNVEPPGAISSEAYSVQVFERVYHFHQDVLARYFRNLYHVVKFVDDADFNDDFKRKYTSIIRAQLSAFELVTLYYNGLSKHGRDGFKPLIEKYGLLKNMNMELLNPKHQNSYADSAFE